MEASESKGTAKNDEVLDQVPGKGMGKAVKFSIRFSIRQGQARVSSRSRSGKRRGTDGDVLDQVLGKDRRSGWPDGAVLILIFTC
jgi:hypothetical protein